MSALAASPKRYSIRVTVLSLLLSVVAVTVLCMTLAGYLMGAQLAEQATRDSFKAITALGSERALALERRGATLATALAQEEAMLRPHPSEADHPLIQRMSALMDMHDAIFSLFAGYPDGAYLEVVNLDAADEARTAWKARPDERWLAVRIFDTANERIEMQHFLDRDLKTLRTLRSVTDFRATERPWYRQALPDKVTQMPPYILSLTDVPGVSYTQRVEGDVVVGSIVLLSSLQHVLSNDRYPDTSMGFLFAKNGLMIAAAGNKAGAIAQESFSDETGDALQSELTERAQDQANLGRILRIKNHSGSGDWFAYLAQLDGLEHLSNEVLIGLVVDESEIMSEYTRQLKISLLIALAIAILMVPLAMNASRLITAPMRLLTEQNNRVRDRQFDQVESVSSYIEEVVDLSRSLTMMSASIREYEQQQKALLDAFIKLIAQAIDDKSPYTGGHCERVPAIAMMLAEHAERDNGAFADFGFVTQDQRREFEIAAWLHDCGKITTPEHIVDKGSKLEAIYNRIHEVRMRFEVLLRDAEIDFLRALAAAPERHDQLKEDMLSRQQKIKEDFAFIAACNVGGEFMDDAQLERLREIAAQTWERQLDDRLGLSPVEEQHLQAFPSQTPCIEPLLSDKPAHITLRENEDNRYAGLGFTMQAPNAKQNLGEIYNLSIRRGTLTEEDRYIIQEHISATIKMLETLPLPSELQRVPEIAGGHHEKLDGKGYPKGLSADQLSVAARIMAIADIFEALTASDRPYKKAKTVSESLRIMRFMALDQHIDPQLFRLFVEQGVYREYAERFLDPSQCDEVDQQAVLEAVA